MLSGLICSSVSSTVISHVAVFPFSVFAVIVAVPFPTAVTFPVLSTVATFVSLLVHVIPLFTFALFGVIVTDSCISFVPFKSNVSLVLFNAMLSGLISLGVEPDEFCKYIFGSDTP